MSGSQTSFRNAALAVLFAALGLFFPSSAEAKKTRYEAEVTEGPMLVQVTVVRSGDKTTITIDLEMDEGDADISNTCDVTAHLIHDYDTEDEVPVLVGQKQLTVKRGKLKGKIVRKFSEPVFPDDVISIAFNADDGDHLYVIPLTLAQ